MNKSGIKQVFPSVRVSMGSDYVEQPLPNHSLDQIDPFILLHHWKTHFPGGQSQKELGVGPHPHRGFSPVTFIFEGAIHHRDSLGNDSVVSAGGAQWINSGNGIIHSERPSAELAEKGGPMELIQLWINTPAKHKMESAEYFSITDTINKDLSSNQPIISNFAGNFEGQNGPIKTNSPLTILSVDFPAGSSRKFSFEEEWNFTYYQLDGKLLINQEQETSKKQLVWLDQTLRTHEFKAIEDTRILIMAGQALKEKTVSYGPFVMNSEAEINQAYLDFRTGKMGQLNETFKL